MGNRPIATPVVQTSAGAVGGATASADTITGDDRAKFRTRIETKVRDLSRPKGKRPKPYSSWPVQIGRTHDPSPVKSAG